MSLYFLQYQDSHFLSGRALNISGLHCRKSEGCQPLLGLIPLHYAIKMGNLCIRRIFTMYNALLTVTKRPSFVQNCEGLVEGFCFTVRGPISMNQCRFRTIYIGSNLPLLFPCYCFHVKPFFSPTFFSCKVVTFFKKLIAWRQIAF